MPSHPLSSLRSERGADRQPDPPAPQDLREADGAGEACVAGGPVFVPLGEGRSVEVQDARSDRSRLSVRDEQGRCLDVEIRFDSAGPIVNVRAHTLELASADRVAVDCRAFEVEASESISLRSGGDLRQHAIGAASVDARNVALTAEPGAVRVKANDDVQLLGENILLNCERAKPLPEWTLQRVLLESAQPQSASLRPEQEAGHADLIDHLSQVDVPEDAAAE